MGRVGVLKERESGIRNEEERRKEPDRGSSRAYLCMWWVERRVPLGAEEHGPENT